MHIVYIVHTVYEYMVVTCGVAAVSTVAAHQEVLDMLGQINK